MLLSRRRFLQQVIEYGAITGAARELPAWDSTSETALLSRALDLYNRTISGDSLVYTEDYSSSVDPPTLSAIRNSGMTYAFYDVSITPNGRSFEDCVRSVALWNESVARHPSALIRADSAADIVEAKKQGKHALIYLFQDGHPLEKDPGRLKLFYDLGVRVIQLTHNNRNLLGDGYVDRVNGGLSDFGVQVVEAMNSLRVLVDLSHCGEQTTIDAVRHSRRPCAFTHAGCRAILPAERNKTDEQIRLLANKGGVIGIFNMSCWLTESDSPELDAVVNHIDHAVNVGGIDHVGFGSDGPMTGVQRLNEELAGHVQFFQNSFSRRVYTRRPVHVRVPSLNEPRRLLVLAEELLRRGYKSAEVEKIIGGNFFRLFKEVVG